MLALFGCPFLSFFFTQSFLTISNMTVTSRGREMIAIVSVLVGVSFITVIMRVLARLKRRVKFGIDDYLCFLSMGLLLAMLIELILCEYLLFYRIYQTVTDSLLKG